MEQRGGRMAEGSGGPERGMAAARWRDGSPGKPRRTALLLST